MSKTNTGPTKGQKELIGNLAGTCLKNGVIGLEPQKKNRGRTKMK